MVTADSQYSVTPVVEGEPLRLTRTKRVETR